MLTTLVLLLALASPALADTGRCITYEQKTLGQWHTLCDNGTRAVSRYNRVLDRFETTITESPRKVCTGHMDPLSKQVQLHCR
jgi:hypothetical protein